MGPLPSALRCVLIHRGPWIGPEPGVIGGAGRDRSEEAGIGMGRRSFLSDKISLPA